MIRCVLVLGIGLTLPAEAGAGCMLPPERHREPPAGYQDRGDRCEGLFVQPVSYPTAIEIVGLHAHSPGYEGHERRHELRPTVYQYLRHQAKADAVLAAVGLLVTTILGFGLRARLG